MEFQTIFHIPLMLTCLCCKPVFDTNIKANTNANSKDNSIVIRLRWDHVDLTSYHNYTGQELLQSILNTTNIFTSTLDSGVSPEGAVLFVLVSGVCPEGAVDRHSGVSPDGATAEAQVTNLVNRLYSNVVDVLHGGANQFIPSYKTSFYKFLRSQELDILKESSIASDRIWKAAGKPRSGRIFQNRNVDRNAYRKINKRSVVRN